MRYRFFPDFDRFILNAQAEPSMFSRQTGELGWTPGTVLHIYGFGGSPLECSGTSPICDALDHIDPEEEILCVQIMGTDPNKYIYCIGSPQLELLLRDHYKKRQAEVFGDAQ